MTSPDKTIKASCSVFWHALWYLIKSSIIIPFQVFGTKIKRQTNTSLFELRWRLSGISHSAVIFNKTLYSSIPLILSGISCAIWEAGGQLCSRWWLTSPLISDPGQCFPPWTTCRKMQGVPLQGIRAEQHLSWGCYKTQSKINCIPSQLLMISELGKKSFGYSWYPGPSGILTLNTHSDADWNAFPHTHSWHVFFSILSSWVWGRETAVRAAASSHSRTVRWTTDKRPGAQWRHQLQVSVV